ncbi:MAG: ArsR/SmtB family transcription factor [Candidatus Nanohalobium sp.]
MVQYFKDDRLFEASELDEEKLAALDSDVRLKILRLLSESASYPSQVAEEFSIDKQKAYYHFRKLEQAGLIEESHSENVSGGSASFYRPSSDGFVLDLESDGRPFRMPERQRSVVEFLEPLIRDGELEGSVVAGSPDQHGPDQVRARDGHLAGEVAAKIGKYCDPGEKKVTRLDTEVVRSKDFKNSFLLLGGVLTNTLTKKFNEAFPACFAGEEFPYRRIETPEASYTQDNIGVVAKARHPDSRRSKLFLVAGVRNSGTEAAVRAFKNLESLTNGYEDGEFYKIVKGLDLDGDGEVDDFEVIE